jgi:ketosteroid isomerase-like protein
MDQEKLVRETWSALSGGELAVMERVLAPDARWRAVEEGPWNCESRSQIIEVMGQNLARGLSGQVEQVLDAGAGRAIVAFRPDGSQAGGWPLEDGVRWVVLSFGEDGLITEMKGCATKRDALDYAG